MSPSQFESHAGFCKRRQPEVSCTICGTGGELVSCDGCTRSFHTVCLELQSVLDSGWYCSCCMDLRVRSGSAIPSSGAIRSDKLRSRLILKAETDQLLCCTLCKYASASRLNCLTIFLLSYTMEAFDPIVEGGQDLISAMVHAEDAAGKLLGGVYCAIITVK
ncbi:hypothetical protein B296_00039573 [Ensete ventricosum]|uniref:PHD-type domain-containing protein n=1 Tax=Ensete ventricosum TaxID=4639 RepID=A0A426ZSV2_ENSVE|nr:hypothetical protein B296_00039573 [Ensete ventricosum]